MATEEPLDDDEAEGGDKPKKTGSKVLLLALAAVALLALAGGGAYMFLSGDPAPETKKAGEQEAGEEAEAVANEEAAKLGDVLALDAFIVNLAGESGKRYLKITMQLEMNNSTLAEEIQNKMPQIKDSVITVLSSKTTDDLLTIEGKFLLKEQLLTRVNSLLRTGVVKNVYFVEFVIQ